MKNNPLKTVSFTLADRELVQRIEKYQKTHNLSSFVATVRKLCDDALTLKKITK